MSPVDGEKIFLLFFQSVAEGKHIKCSTRVPSGGMAELLVESDSIFQP
jgi:hypothetical protein